MKIIEIDVHHNRYSEERNLRSRVLREPIGFPPGSEEFPFEPDSRHFLALDDKDEVIGCVLMHPREEGIKLYQMAVDTDHQGRGVGRLLVEYFERQVLRMQNRKIFLHARWEVREFYRRLGYLETGEPFTEIGIQHIRMEKQL